MPRRLEALVLIGVCLPFTGACGRPDRADYANRMASDVQTRTVPPGANGLSSTETSMRPCAIGRTWRFSTDWNRARYVDWLKAQLLPEFTLLREGPDQLTVSRHDDGDTRSLTVETQPGSDTIRVSVTLCVYPD